MAVVVNSNISSLRGQRELLQHTASLQRHFQRLSSGLRINGASDDAAGLSVASLLRLDERIYTQGVRNLNDALSVLNTAEGAVSQLSNVLLRLTELAQQAANGVVSTVQRGAIDREAQLLRDEFNRILSVTSFNGTTLLDGSLGSASVQAGYGTNGSLDLSLGSQLPEYATADGSFKAKSAVSIPPQNSYRIADLNSDGVLDIIDVDIANLGVSLGNGDGTFRARKTYNVQGDYDIEIADFNHDGYDDVVTNRLIGTTFRVALGNGDGTLKAQVAYTTPIGSSIITSADFNGDGNLDIAGGERYLYVCLGNGDGTFRRGTSMSGTSGNSPRNGIHAYDLDGDGDIDLVQAGQNDGTLVHLNNGDGTFRLATSYGNSTSNGVSGADLNNDGIIDLAVGTIAGLEINFGNGNGTFRSPVLYNPQLSTSALTDVLTVDINSDGILDVIAEEAGGGRKARAFLGNGNATFRLGTSFSLGSADVLLSGDMNGDGIQDVVTSTYSVGVAILFGNGSSFKGLGPLSLTTQHSALTALEFLRGARNDVSSELGTIGTQASRFQTAVSGLRQASEQIGASAARIQDVDVAEETVGVVQTRILQQATSGILVQANQQPAIALQLLSQVDFGSKVLR